MPAPIFEEVTALEEFRDLSFDERNSVLDTWALEARDDIAGNLTEDDEILRINRILDAELDKHRDAIAEEGTSIGETIKEGTKQAAMSLVSMPFAVAGMAEDVAGKAVNLLGSPGTDRGFKTRNIELAAQGLKSFHERLSEKGKGILVGMDAEDEFKILDAHKERMQALVDAEESLQTYLNDARGVESEKEFGEGLESRLRDVARTGRQLAGDKLDDIASAGNPVNPDNAKLVAAYLQTRNPKFIELLKRRLTTSTSEREQEAIKTSSGGFVRGLQRKVGEGAAFVVDETKNLFGSGRDPEAKASQSQLLDEFAMGLTEDPIDIVSSLYGLAKGVSAVGKIGGAAAKQLGLVKRVGGAAVEIGKGTAVEAIQEGATAIATRNDPIEAAKLGAVGGVEFGLVGAAGGAVAGKLRERKLLAEAEKLAAEGAAPVAPAPVAPAPVPVAPVAPEVVTPSPTDNSRLAAQIEENKAAGGLVVETPDVKLGKLRERAASGAPGKTIAELRAEIAAIEFEEEVEEVDDTEEVETPIEEAPVAPVAETPRRDVPEPFIPSVFEGQDYEAPDEVEETPEATPAPVEEAPEAELPVVTPERTAMIEKLVEAARKAGAASSMTIVQLYPVQGSDGKFYTGGMPFGVKVTGERGAPYYVRETSDGTTHGSRHATREAAQSELDRIIQSQDDEFRGELSGMDASALNAQAAYWLKEKPVPVDLPPLKDRRRKGSASRKPESKPLHTGSVEDDAKLGEYRKRLAMGRSLLGSEEYSYEQLEKQAAADPAKWMPGQGVGWKPVKGQTNRGYRIMSVDPETKTAVIKSIADTGLTTTGDGGVTGSTERVRIADLVKDRKYDKQEGSTPVEAPPVAAPPIAPIEEAPVAPTTVPETPTVPAVEEKPVSRERFDAGYVQRARRHAMQRISYDPELKRRYEKVVGEKMTNAQAADLAVEWMQLRTEAGEPALIDDALAKQPDWSIEAAWKNIGPRKAGKGNVPAAEEAPVAPTTVPETLAVPVRLSDEEIEAFVEALSDEDLDAFASRVDVKRHGVNDARLRRKVLDNTHPDDLIEALSATRSTSDSLPGFGPVESVAPAPVPKTPSVIANEEAKSGKVLQKSPFVPKVATAQKKFLLEALDSAIEEAPDWHPEGSEDTDAAKDLKMLEDVEAMALSKFPATSVEAVEAREKSVREDAAEQFGKYEGASGNPAALKELIEKAHLSQLPHVHIEVPGDGTFDILNTKSALRDFKKLADKFPTTASRAVEPKLSEPEATSVPKLGKPKTPQDVVEALVPFASTDPDRLVLNTVYSNGEVMLSTNGRLIAIVDWNGPGNEDNPAFFDLKGRQLSKNAAGKLGKYPNWKMVVPNVDANWATVAEALDTGRMFTVLAQAKAIKPEGKKGKKYKKSEPSVSLHLNKDGSLGLSKNVPDVGSYEHNMQEGAEKLVSLNEEYLMNVMHAARDLGHETVALQMLDDRDPAVFTAKGFKGVLMPMRVVDSANPAVVKAKEIQARLGVTATPIVGPPSKPKAKRSRKQVTDRLNELPPSIRKNLGEAGQAQIFLEIADAIVHGIDNAVALVNYLAARGIEMANGLARQILDFLAAGGVALGMAIGQKDVPTNVGNREDTVAGRLRNAAKSGQVVDAKVLFDGAGIGTTLIEASDGSQDVLMKPDRIGSNAKARKLLAAVEDALGGTETLEREYRWGVLTNALRKYILQDTTIDRDVAEALYALAQGEASVAGVVLHAARGVRLDVDAPGEILSVELRADNHRRYGGKLIDEMVRRFRRFLGDTVFDEVMASDFDALTQIEGTSAEPPLPETTGKVYRAVQFALTGGKDTTRRTKELQLKVAEAIKDILEKAKVEGFGVKPSKVTKLTPWEKLGVATRPRTEQQVRRLVEDAVRDAEEQAGRFISGSEDYTQEDVEAGFDHPRFAHWRVIRDEILEYSPTTVSLVDSLIKAEYKRRAPKGRTAARKDPRIDMDALAKSPANEIERAINALMAKVEAVLDVSKATVATRDRVGRMVRERITAEVEAKQRQIVGRIEAGKDADFSRRLPRTEADAEEARLAALEKLGEAVNAGMAGSVVDAVALKSVVTRNLPRFDEIVKTVYKTPAKDQDALADAFADTIIVELGVDPAIAGKLGAILAKSYWTKFQEGRKRALQRLQDSLSATDRTQLNIASKGANRRPSVWSIMERLANSHGLDTGDVLRAIAASHGKPEPTDADVARLKSLVEEKQELHENQLRRVLDATGKVALIETVRLRNAETERRQNEIAREIRTIWSKYMHSTKGWWKSEDARANRVKFVNETMIANRMAKWGTLARQWLLDLPYTVVVSNVAFSGAKAAMRMRDAKSRGERTQFASDWLTSTGDAYVQQFRAMRTTLNSVKEAMEGRSNREVDKDTQDAINAFERLDEVVREIDKGSGSKGMKLLQKTLIHVLSFPRIAFRVMAASDQVVGRSREVQMQHAEATTRLYASGLSLKEARRRATLMIGNERADYLLAFALTSRNSPMATKAERAAAANSAWNVVRAMRYDMMERALGTLGTFEEDVRQAMNVQGWNEREVAGPGGLVKSAMQMSYNAALWMARLPPVASLATLPLQLALSFVSGFSNAAALGINFAASRSGLAFVPSAFRKTDDEGNVTWSPLFGSEELRLERKFETAIAGGLPLATILAMASMGMVRVYNRLPEDDNERRTLEDAGVRSGSIVFRTPDGKQFLSMPLTNPVMSNIRVWLASIGAWQDYMDGLVRKNKLLAKDFESDNKARSRKGLEPIEGEPPVLEPDAGFLTLSMLGEAAGGLVGGGHRGIGLTIPDMRNLGSVHYARTAATMAESVLPGMPLVDETVKMATGTGIAEGTPGLEKFDQVGGLADLLDTTPWSGGRTNQVGDTMGPGLKRRILGTFTGINPIPGRTGLPYEILAKLPDFSPTTIGKDTGMSVDRWKRLNTIKDRRFGELLRSMDPGDPELLRIVRKADTDAKDYARRQLLPLQE